MAWTEVACKAKTDPLEMAKLSAQMPVWLDEICKENDVPARYLAQFLTSAKGWMDKSVSSFMPTWKGKKKSFEDYFKARVSSGILEVLMVDYILWRKEDVFESMALLLRSTFKKGTRGKLKYEDAEDIQQEVYLIIMRLKTYNPGEGHVEPYVGRILNNRICNFYRKSKKKPLWFVGEEEHQLDVLSSFPDPAWQAEQKDLYEKAVSEKEKLSPKQKEALDLAVNLDWKDKEKAALLLWKNLSTNKVSPLFTVTSPIQSLNGHIPPQFVTAFEEQGIQNLSIEADMNQNVFFQSQTLSFLRGIKKGNKDKNLFMLLPRDHQQLAVYEVPESSYRQNLKRGEDELRERLDS